MSSKFYFDVSSDEKAEAGLDARSKLLSKFLFDASFILGWGIVEPGFGDREQEGRERREKKKRKER